jgi:hypothetical protein
MTIVAGLLDDSPAPIRPPDLPTEADGVGRGYAGVRQMHALLTVMVTWLSINFGLPAIDEHPQVHFASAREMADVRHGRLASTDAAHQIGEPTQAAFGHDVHAIYDDQSRTIYLPEGWTGETPAEVSVLVHELVHHMQNVAGVKYDCAEAREKPAYQAQARWLELFGQNLADEFEIDAMTILVRTNCMH